MRKRRRKKRTKRRRRRSPKRKRRRRRTGGSVAKRKGRGRRIARSARGFLAKLPKPQLMKSAYYGIVRVVGNIANETFDIPWFSEEAVTWYLAALLARNPAERQVLANVAAGEQLYALAKEAGFFENLKDLLE